MVHTRSILLLNLNHYLLLLLLQLSISNLQYPLIIRVPWWWWTELNFRLFNYHSWPRWNVPYWTNLTWLWRLLLLLWLLFILKHCWLLSTFGRKDWLLVLWKWGLILSMRLDGIGVLSRWLVNLQQRWGISCTTDVYVFSICYLYKGFVSWVQRGLWLLLNWRVVHHIICLRWLLLI